MAIDVASPLFADDRGADQLDIGEVRHMSWTIVCDLQMMAYQGNRVLDATNYHNDANLIGNVQQHLGFVGFHGPDAQLEVPVRDQSLGRFTALRVQVLFRPAPITHRFNLVEGWMSFALVIRDDGRLSGTIYDGHNWLEVNSGATTIVPNQWSRVAFEYDGVSIAALRLNDATVGSRFDMPIGIRQPQQVITLGHWPRGDDRYTFVGDLGHVRIEKRDYEDYARDGLCTAFCRRRLSPEQAEALRQLRFVMRTLPSEERERFIECFKAKSDRMRMFMRKLRTWGVRDMVRLRTLESRLRAAWCCAFDASEAHAAFLEYFRAISGAPGSPERARFHAALDEFFDIAKMCSWPGQPYERMRELSAILFPELSSLETNLRVIADSV